MTPPSPPSPSGSMGRRPVLEWERYKSSGSRVRVGPLVLEADDDGWWSVGGLRRATPETMVRPIEAAQLAAEEACKALLCGALAAFADPDTRDFTVIRDRYAACSDVYLAQDNRCTGGHPFFAMTKDEMRRLALSLLRASESTSTGGER